MPVLILFQDPGARLALGRSEATTGTVLQVTARDGDQARSASITYSFRPKEGPEYRTSQAVGASSSYAHVRPGENVPVTFLVSDPSVSRIAGQGDSAPELFILLLIFPIFGLLFLGPLFLPRIRIVLLDRKLFRTGRVTTGTVVFVKQSVGWTWPGWPGWYAAQVFVRFDLPTGAPAEATATCQNEWLLQHLPPGAPVRIAYSPDRPSRAVLLNAYVR
jgi:hypothetical protein